MKKGGNRKIPRPKPFGGMNPTEFFRKIRDEKSRKRTW